MKLKLAFLLLFWYPLSAEGRPIDTLTLEQCYQLAYIHYPLLQQDPLLKQKLSLAIRDLDSRYLPRLSLQAQATYQSEVTTIPIKFPDMSVPPVPKDQYRAVLEVQQLVYDGGNIQKRKKIQEALTALSVQNQKVTFYQLKRQINDWYANILIIQAKRKACATQLSNLVQQIDQVKAAIKNGIALPSHLDELRVALLQTEQQMSALKADLQSGIAALAIITGQKLTDSVHLVLPSAVAPDIEGHIQRPELQQFALKDQLLGQKAELLQADHLPQVKAFVQGGYGRPGLNMLNTDFDWFYMGGIQMHWNLWDWHKKQREQQSLKIDAEKLQLEKAHFLLQTNRELTHALLEIRALEESVQKDKQIVRLRNKIRKSAASQLIHGVITSTEYLIKLNDETAASIRQQSHVIRLRFARLNYQLLKNN